MNKTSMLFPGQGSQYVGMGKFFYEKYSSARLIFEEANDILKFNIRDLCFNGRLEELTKTENTQPAILTVSVIQFKICSEEIGITPPQYVAGHSIGELSAVTCAGGVKFADALKIVRKRGELMMRALSPDVGRMCSIIGVEKNIIEEECLKSSTDNEVVVISNYNSLDQIVISGNKNSVIKVCENLSRMGAIVAPLNVSSAFHSPLMKPVIKEFSDELSNYKFYDTKIPVVSNVNALPYSKADEIRNNLIMQIEKPVKWQESMDYLQKHGIELAIELGPKTILKKLMKENTPQVTTYSYDNAEDRQLLKEIFISKKGKNKKKNFINMCLSAAICTKNHNWNDEEYRSGVLEPYQQIKEMRNKLVVEEEEQEPTIAQMKEALEILKTIFITKKVPTFEQMERLNFILEETDTKGCFGDFTI